VSVRIVGLCREGPEREVVSTADVATLARGDLDIYYETVGTGPRLLLFNGSGATIASARLLIDFLAASFTVLVHDQRGLGRTGLPSDGRPFTMADYAADGAALLDHLDWPSALVFGISFGGMVAQEFAVTWPERVERMALLCTSPGGAGGSSYPLHKLDSLGDDERAEVSLRNLDTRFSADWLSTHPGDLALVKQAAEREATPATAAERRGARMQLEARSGHDVWSRLDRITCPTFIACGRYDGLAPPGNSEAIASRIAASTFREYEGGHLFVIQDPLAPAEIVAFLRGETGPDHLS
jgi:3-oxoadipate enol-lactonase